MTGSEPKKQPIGLSLPTSLAAPTTCPCGSGMALTACCGRVHSDHAAAETPEQLMRARYSAYALRRRAFLKQSWHSSTRPSVVDLDDEAEWLGLTIDFVGDVVGDEGEVAFTARYHDAALPTGGNAYSLVERSRFVREDGRWYYVDAIE